jgi:hypothetical protein
MTKPSNSFDLLQDALEKKIASNHDIFSHATMLDEISKQYSHSVVMQPAPCEPIDSANCVMYALNILFDYSYALVTGEYHANNNFVSSLIEQNRIENVGNNPDLGSLAIYFRESKPVHIGLVYRLGRIRSKWGSAHLYEHPPLEVPSSYGKDVKYFCAIDAEFAFELLQQFSRAVKGNPTFRTFRY